MVVSGGAFPSPLRLLGAEDTTSFAKNAVAIGCIFLIRPNRKPPSGDEPPHLDAARNEKLGSGIRRSPHCIGFENWENGGFGRRFPLTLKVAGSRRYNLFRKKRRRHRMYFFDRPKPKASFRGRAPSLRRRWKRLLQTESAKMSPPKTLEGRQKLTLAIFAIWANGRPDG
jgi:hypothetical protein